MAAFTIAWNGLRRTVRERQNLFWMFVAPLMFVSFFGVLLRPSPMRPTRVAIVNEDAPGTAAARFATALVADGVDARVVQTRPAADSGLALVIPKGTSDALAAGTGVKVVLLAGVEQTNEERRLQFKIQKAVVDLTLQGGEAEATMTTGSAPLAVQRASLDIRQQGNTRGFQFAVPAYLVMFTFMNLLVSGAALAEERAAGQLRRLAMAPIGFNQIILGKLLVRVAVGWAQMGYLLLVGILVFNIHWGGNPASCPTRCGPGADCASHSDCADGLYCATPELVCTAKVVDGEGFLGVSPGQAVRDVSLLGAIPEGVAPVEGIAREAARPIDEARNGNARTPRNQRRLFGPDGRPIETRGTVALETIDIPRLQEQVAQARDRFVMIATDEVLAQSS